MFGLTLLVLLSWAPVIFLGVRLKSGIWSGQFRILGTTYVRSREPVLYWTATTLCSAMFLFLLYVAAGLSVGLAMIVIWPPRGGFPF